MGVSSAADVLVLGLGPAGLAAAKTLAEGGAKMLAVDKSPSPGGKACAGGLTRRSCSLLGYSPERPWRFSSHLPLLELKTPLGTAILRGEGAAVVTVDRPSLSKLQLEELTDLRVDVRLGTSSPLEGFAAVVACDGATSRTRRALGLPSAVGIAALQLRIDEDQARRAGLSLDRATVWFEPRLWKSGYAWSFPALGEVRLGCGVPLSTKAGFRSRFAAFLGKLGLGLDSGRLEAGWIGTRYCGHRFGRIRLAGDAAGLASPLTGEGIYPALVSGKEVARELLDPRYASKLIAQLASSHRRTVQALDSGGAAAFLYPISPALLRLGPIARLTERKYLE